MKNNFVADLIVLPGFHKTITVLGVDHARSAHVRIEPHRFQIQSTCSRSIRRWHLFRNRVVQYNHAPRQARTIRLITLKDT